MTAGCHFVCLQTGMRRVIIVRKDVATVTKVGGAYMNSSDKS